MLQDSQGQLPLSGFVKEKAAVLATPELRAWEIGIPRHQDLWIYTGSPRCPENTSIYFKQPLLASADGLESTTPSIYHILLYPMLFIGSDGHVGDARAKNHKGNSEQFFVRKTHGSLEEGHGSGSTRRAPRTKWVAGYRTPIYVEPNDDEVVNYAPNEVCIL